MGAGAVGNDGVHTNTEDTDCDVCKGDLFLAAVVSLAAPGRAVCPEHASTLPGPQARRHLLYRCGPASYAGLSSGSSPWVAA